MAGKADKTDRKGNNMKFISWNVNGLRACMQKGFLDFFKEIDADIFCLQETKLQEGQIDLNLPGYHQYWKTALSIPSAIFIRTRPESTPGGHTESRRERKMPDGELTISWYRSACRTDWQMRRSTRKFRDRTIVRSSLIYNRQKTAKGDL